jgi:type II secretory pathway component PulF
VAEVPDRFREAIVSEGTGAPEPTNVGPRLSRAEAAQFAGQVAELSAAGSPLAEGLRAAAEETTNRRLRKAFTIVAARLEAGEALGRVLASDSVKMPPYVRGLVEAGLRSGQLSQVLTELVEHHRTIRELWRGILLASAYPLFLVVVVVGLYIFTFAFIMPPLVALFVDFDTELPALTVPIVVLTRCVEGGVAWLTGVCHHLASWPALLAIAAVVSLLVAAHYWLRNKRAYHRVWAEGWWLCCTFPVLGPLLAAISVTAFARLMRILLLQQVPLPEALRLTGASVPDVNVAEMSRRLADATAAGRPLSDLLAGTSRLPALLVPWVRWGERTDRLPEAFGAIAEMCEGRVRLRAALLKAILPPLAYVMVGGAAAGVISAIALPLVALIQNLA